MNSSSLRQCFSSPFALAAVLALGGQGCALQPVFMLSTLPTPQPVTVVMQPQAVALPQAPQLAEPVQPLQAVAPSVFAFTWAQNLVAYRGQTGQQFTVQCPPNGTAATVWGTDYYSDDSSVCTAAAHSGRVSLAQGGSVRVMLTAAGQSYTGTTRAGLSSQSYGAWPGSFVLVEGPAPGLVATPLAPPTPTAPPEVHFVPGVAAEVNWATNAVALRGQLGREYLALCPANGSAGSVWGSQGYTDDSSLCTAAAHMGLITLVQGGLVHFWMHPGQARYAGSRRQDIASSNYGAWAGTFAFGPELQPVAPPPAGPHGSLTLSWTDDASQWRDDRQHAVLVYCPPGGAVTAIWGTGVYTDDSSVCSAAVHAGLFTAANGGLARVQPAGGRARYAASDRNGVSSSEWESFEGSFTLRAYNGRPQAPRTPVVVEVDALE